MKGQKEIVLSCARGRLDNKRKFHCKVIRHWNEVDDGSGEVTVSESTQEMLECGTWDMV